MAENNIFWVNQILPSLGKQTTNNIFSENELDRIRGAMLATARKKISINEDNYDSIGLHSVLPSAIMMEWQEILDALIDNSSYLTTLLELFKKSNFKDILRWSLTDNCKLVENIVFQLKSDPSSIEQYHQRSFPSHSFALAVAWKRSQHFWE